MITRRISERRRGPSRAGRAKSCGSVSAQGEANPAQNSFRQHLRASDLFLRPRPQGELIIDADTSESQPQSTAERRTVKSLATSERQQTWTNPATLPVLAFRCRTDRSCVLHFIHRLDSRLARHHERAFDRLREFQTRSAWEAEFAREVNITERTREVIENTWPPHDAVAKVGGREGKSDEIRGAKTNINERTPELVEDRTTNFGNRPKTH